MLIAFDYDGVLVDSLARLVRLAGQAQAMIGHGRAPCAQDFRTIANLTFGDLGSLVGIPTEHLALFHTHVLTLQQQAVELPPLFPGMAQALQRLATQGVLVVVTASASSEVERVLTTHRLRQYITQIFDGADPRPKAAKIAAACAGFQQAPQHTYMVGDTRGDMRQGKLAGVKTVGVTWGYQAPAMLQLESPDYLAHTPADLVTIVTAGQRHSGQEVL